MYCLRVLVLCECYSLLSGCGSLGIIQVKITAGDPYPLCPQSMDGYDRIATDDMSESMVNITYCSVCVTHACVYIQCMSDFSRRIIVQSKEWHPKYFIFLENENPSLRTWKLGSELVLGTGL